MKSSQKWSDLFNRKLVLEARKQRLMIGLPIFQSMDEFKQTKIVEKSFMSTRILLDNAAKKVLRKCHLPHTEQNIQAVVEIIITDKTNRSEQKPWSPAVGKLNLKDKKRSFLFFKVYDDVRREHFELWWRKNKTFISLAQNFLPHSLNKDGFRVQLDKKNQYLKLYIFSETRLKRVKTSWGTISKLKIRLPNHSEKTRPINEKFFRALNRFDDDKYEYYNDKRKVMTDKDKASKMSEDLPMERTAGSVKQMRHRQKKYRDE